MYNVSMCYVCVCSIYVHMYVLYMGHVSMYICVMCGYVLYMSICMYCMYGMFSCTCVICTITQLIILER